MEDPQLVLATRPRQVAQIGLVVAAGARPRAVVVEPPDDAVGQHAPAHATLGSQVRGLQIAQDLTVRRVAGGAVAGVPHVQRQPEALALLHDQGAAESRLRILLGDGARLRCGVGEQQVVGDVFVSRRTLLRQVVPPAQCLQQRPHQLLFGGRLVQGRHVAEGVELAARRLVEGGEGSRFRERAFPVRRRLDAVGQKILREQLAAHVGSLNGWQAICRLGTGVRGRRENSDASSPEHGVMLQYPQSPTTSPMCTVSG